MQMSSCIQKSHVTLQFTDAARRNAISNRSRSMRPVRANADDEAAKLKAMEEAMKDPAIKARMEAMQEQMKQPEVQQSMAEMQAVMSNPAFMQKMAELREDPELKPMFEEMRTGGMAAMMKFMNDPTFLAKIGEKMKDVIPAGGATGGAAVPPPPAEINDILDAARFGDLEAIEDFIAVGKGGTRDNEGRGAVHYAVAYDQVNALETLLSSGADISIVDSKGNTCLHYAAGYARPGCIQALLKAGADKGFKNEGGQTPYDVVIDEPRNPMNQDTATLGLLKV